MQILAVHHLTFCVGRQLQLLWILILGSIVKLSDVCWLAILDDRGSINELHQIWVLPKGSEWSFLFYDSSCLMVFCTVLMLGILFNVWFVSLSEKVAGMRLFTIKSPSDQKYWIVVSFVTKENLMGYGFGVWYWWSIDRPPYNSLL